MRTSFKSLYSLTLLALAAISTAQTWSLLKNKLPVSVANPTLMYDGTVLMQSLYTGNWYKLTPDNKGSYVNGTVSKIASMPSGYGPTFYASAVLPDGRFFCLGGEYNMGNGPLWTNMGAIYDPVKNSWTKLTPPSAWSQIGDTGSIPLPDGRLLICNAVTNDSSIFDWRTNAFTTPTVKGKADGNDEEGLCMLPNGNILTVDAVNQGQSEIFNTTTMTWSSAGATAGVNIVDAGSEEIGPMVLRPDGSVLCMGGSVNNVIYNANTSTWSVAPSLPGGNQCADAGACLLPNGNVLVAASPGVFGSPLNFFEWNGSAFNAVPATATAGGNTCFTVNMLTLPTGQILVTQENNDVEIYNPTGGPQAAWRPTVTSVPSVIHQGLSTQVFGTQLSGLSGASAYGDDQQNYTNFALVRITNNATGHVLYAKTTLPSTYKVVTGNTVQSTHVSVPSTAELGSSLFQFVTNGIASAPVAVTIAPAADASTISTFIGNYSSGTVSSVWQLDGSSYVVNSVKDYLGQDSAVEVDYVIPGLSASSFSITANVKAAANVTGILFAFDNVSSQWVAQGSAPLGTGLTTLTSTGSPSPTRYVDRNGRIRFMLRGERPLTFGSAGFTMSIDSFWVNFQ